MKRMVLAGIISILCGSLSTCVLDAQYAKPSVPMSDAYKESASQTPNADGQWTPAHPQDDSTRGAWWSVFKDSQLNALEEELTASNQDLKIAESRYSEARTLIRLNRAAEAPTITVSPSVASIRDSANRPYFSQSMVNNGTGDMVLPFDLSYEVDLWGRIRKQVKAARDQAQASAADRANVQLSLQAELAFDYFELRSADMEKVILDATVASLEKALQIEQSLYDGGVVSVSIVARANTRLEAARVQSTDIDAARSQFEHAIAVLTGKPPALFHIASEADYRIDLPQIPVGIPSELLERRPDISASERLVATANEQIGIARTAYYPSLNLGLEAGLEGSSILNWLNWPSRFWAIGTQMTQILYDGGRRKATSALAQEQYDAAVAAYRQSTLKAFQEVEDNLAALHTFGAEAQEQKSAISSTEQSLEVSTTRYEGGVDNYLEVLAAQTDVLADRGKSVEIDRRRMDATILLVKAIGGGWDTSKLPRN